MNDGYIYLHTNGRMIYKPYDEHRVMDFRESDFVRMYWPLDLSDRSGAWQILIEAGAIGCPSKELERLSVRWDCDNEDAKIFANEVGLVLSGPELLDDGATVGFAATRKDYDPTKHGARGSIGEGNTALEAMISLCKKLHFRPNKMQWHHTFKELLTLNQDVENEVHRSV